MPHADTVHETDQLTPLFDLSFPTFAVICVVVPSSTVAVFGDKLTVIAGGGVPPPPLHPIPTAPRHTPTTTTTMAFHKPDGFIPSLHRFEDIAPILAGRELLARVPTHPSRKFVRVY
jgi:hypothetical protein